MASRVSESSLPSGSSRISRRGSLTSARASAARCAMPPESWCGWLCANSDSPTKASASSTRAYCACGTLRACRPRATLSRTVRQGNSVGSWNTTMRDGSGWVMAWPSCVMRPCSGASSPATSRSSDDLPQPLGPSKATNSPGASVRLTSSSTCRRPWGVLKAWLTPCSVMRAPWVATSACAVSVTIARFLSATTAAGRALRTAG